jgi:hypothetical protein
MSLIPVTQMITVLPVIMAEMVIPAEQVVPVQYVVGESHVTLPASTTNGAVSIDTNALGFDRAMAFGALQSKIDLWADLDEDWDGAGGVAPPHQVVSNATTFLNEAERAGVKLPQVYVAGDGEVGFRWTRDAAFASVSFLPDGNIVAFARSAGSDSLRMDEPAMMADLKPLFARLRAII